MKGMKLLVKVMKVIKITGQSDKFTGQNEEILVKSDEVTKIIRKPFLYTSHTPSRSLFPIIASSSTRHFVTFVTGFPITVSS
jgi:hypothetical protein